MKRALPPATAAALGKSCRQKRGDRTRGLVFASPDSREAPTQSSAAAIDNPEEIWVIPKIELGGGYPLPRHWRCSGEAASHSRLNSLDALEAALIPRT